MVGVLIKPGLELCFLQPVLYDWKYLGIKMEGCGIINSEIVYIKKLRFCS
jgi:hypothetical protein